MVCSVDSNHKVNQDFEIASIKYQLDTEHEDDLLSFNTAVKPKLQDTLQCKLDLTEVKQLQEQDTDSSKNMQNVQPAVIMIKHLFT